MARLNTASDTTYVTLAYVRAIVLEDFSSLLNSEQLLWTPFKARSLLQKLSATSDGTIEQLQLLLEGADDELLQLSAELVFIQQLFPSQIAHATKIANVRAMLELMTAPVELPAWVSDEQSGNFCRDASFERHRLEHLEWLLRFVVEWHRSPANRDELLRDPWRFRDFVFEIESTPESDSMRNAWLHIMFPDSFEGLSSSLDKIALRDAYLGSLGQAPSANVDADLWMIRSNLTKELGEGFVFELPLVARVPTAPSLSPPMPKPKGIPQFAVSEGLEGQAPSVSANDCFGDGGDSLEWIPDDKSVAGGQNSSQSPTPELEPEAETPSKVESESISDEMAKKPARSAVSKRRIVELLRRDELLEVLDRYELKADRRANDKLVDAIVRAKSARIPEFLPSLSRDTLKEICIALELDDRSREKAPLVQRILVALGEDAPIEADPGAKAPAVDLPSLLARLLEGLLHVTETGDGWPVRGEFLVTEKPHPVDIYLATMTSSDGSDCRFQNQTHRPIIDDPDKHEILMGIWTEQGDQRAVLVAFDLSHKRNRQPRFSANVPVSILEQAADTGYTTVETSRDELVYAFRPDNLGRYFEILRDSPLQLDEHTPKKRDKERAADERRTPTGSKKKSQIYIRPQVGMYAAFARLNYKAWFALSEFLDNSIQSFLHNREMLEAAGHSGPLLIDVNIDDNEISITDRAGGIALSEFPRAFSPAAPPDDATGLSEFGLGMKAAACWFAKKWSVRTSAIGEPLERTVSFDIPKITREGLENLPIESRAAVAADHFTVVTMTDLRVHLRGKTLRKIRDHLSSIYRVLTKEGVVLIRLTMEGRTEELKFEPPDLLEAPFFRDPTGPATIWRKDFVVDLHPRKIIGWAGIMKSGGYSRAGFSVFRRRRLIEGSVGETYKPSTIFRSPNSFSAQRIVGELYVEGFDVTHTKDGIQWHGYEEEVLDAIRQQLNDDPMRLLDQAEGFRAKRVAASLPKEFGTDALRSTVAALSTPVAVDMLRNANIVDDDSAPSSPVNVIVHQHRVFKLQVIRDGRAWDIHLELVSDPAMPFYTTSTVNEAGHDVIKVQVNLDHEFSIGHINDNEATLSPILRLVAALALAEKIARDSGVRSAGTIRHNANQILRAIAGDPAN